MTIDIDDLRTGQGTATNTSGTTTSATHAQRLACNAHLVALYLDSESRVLDHGTARRLYDRHQRLALAVRDQGCIWPACDRPPAWCEAHHLNFWSEDGPTDLDNAALVCHFHHFLLHEGEWTARMADDGVVEVIPPARVDPQRSPETREIRQTTTPGSVRLSGGAGGQEQAWQAVAVSKLLLPSDNLAYPGHETHQGEQRQHT